MAQLSIKDSMTVIMSAIKAASENLDVDFHHAYSTPGQLGIHTEINDFSLERQLNELTKDYDKDDHVFEVAFPMEYFNDDILPEDNSLGINAGDIIDVKAEIRCIDLITKTYKRWTPDHKPFTTQDLLWVIREAQIKLEKLKHISFAVAGNKKEIAEKYIEIWFTEDHIPQIGGSFTDRFFPVEFHIYDYYADIGNNTVDALIGESKLRGKSKKDICLLRVSYLLYSEFIGWLHNKWPKIYNDYMNGKF